MSGFHPIQLIERLNRSHITDGPGTPGYGQAPPPSPLVQALMLEQQIRQAGMLHPRTQQSLGQAGVQPDPLLAALLGGRR